MDSDDLMGRTEALRRVARALCGDEATAEDLAQEALLAGLGRGGVSQGWLAGVVRNLGRGERRARERRRRREEGAARAEGVPSAAELGQRLELCERLARHVRELPPAWAEVLYLRYWEDLPVREVARRLGVGVEAVRMRQKRALARLRGELDAGSEGGREQWLAALVPWAGERPAWSLLGLLASVRGAGAVLVAVAAGAGLWLATRAPLEGGGEALTRVQPLEDEDATSLVDPGSALARRPGEEPSAGDGAQAASSASDLLTGIAVDRDGTPLGGVEVVLRGPRRRELDRSRSDGQGRFELRPRGLLNVGLDGELDGWALVGGARAEHRGPLGWAEARLVFAPGADLLVKVLDAHGDPVEGETVRVRPSPVEDDPMGDPRDAAHVDRRGLSDASGAVLLAGLPAHTRLVVADFTHERDGVLVEGEPREARAIVLEPGEVRTLVLRELPGQRIAGRVRTVQGSPVAGARVSAFVDQGGTIAATESGPAGEFALTIGGYRRHEVTLLAAELSSPALSGGITLPRPLPPETTGIELVLRPALPLSGRLVGIDERPVGAEVHLEPLDGELAGGRLLDGTLPRTMASSSEDGAFRFEALPPGEYRLFVPGVASVPVTAMAGDEGVLVQLLPTRPCRVEVEVQVPGHELERVSILQARLRPLGAEPEVATLPASSVQRAPGNWAPGAPVTEAGVGGLAFGGDLLHFEIDLVRGASWSGDLSPGVWWLGARGRTASGLDCFPVGTGPVRLAEGACRVRFELAPASPVRGRLAGAAPPVDLYVELHGARTGEDGTRRSFVAGAMLVERLPLDGRGGFAIELAPPGSHELWLGTRAELDAGTPRERHGLASDGTPVHVELRGR